MNKTNETKLGLGYQGHEQEQEEVAKIYLKGWQRSRLLIRKMMVLNLLVSFFLMGLLVIGINWDKSKTSECNGAFALALFLVSIWSYFCIDCLLLVCKDKFFQNSQFVDKGPKRLLTAKNWDTALLIWFGCWVIFLLTPDTIPLLPMLEKLAITILSLWLTLPAAKYFRPDNPDKITN